MVNDTDIAIIGMAAHLPGAPSIDSYWTNLRDGVESIRNLTAAELLAAGEAPHMLARPDYVPAAAVLEGFDTFDAEFFGFSPKEAAIMDPQHRQFLEVVWEALENAGHPPEYFDGPVGVFAGCGMGSYFYFNLCSNPDLVENTGMFLLRHTGNDKDFLSTRASFILDLKGPSVNVQTACSTSLVATHMACQSLLNGECDMALAGGVTIELPHARGYLYKEGEILSPDGHCHAFDHRAQGTVFGSGAGAVVLRRLADAVADGDHIWAVIKGSAINNDGASKAGYLAPSVDGQAAAIAEAQAVAGVTADTIDYVECHGTGTYLGDPIEVAALTDAFRRTTDAVDFCRIGSVKTNIGHTDTAAGVASLIKTSLALHHGQMPPSLGYEKPNPVIGFEGSPFRVNDCLTAWPSRAHPPRAGVNSLGVGGTNAHVVLEKAPVRAASPESDWPFQILVISARSKVALDANSAALAAHLLANPDQPLADVAYTLRQGRRAFDKRRVIVAASHAEAAKLLTENDPRRVFSHTVVDDKPEVVFMFPGGGAQYAGMARDLYETEPVFADWMDQGLAILQPKLDYDVRAVWLPEPGDETTASERLKTPSVQLPLIMIVEYALAQLWMSWGVRPAALIGHSMGENTAACLAGVMSFSDCIGLVHLRGQLFDTVPAGGMLSVALPAATLQTHLGPDLDLAAVNAPNLSVATGPQAALDALETRLKALDIDCQRIPINIAAHSRMLEPILARFGAYLRSTPLNPPQIPIISNRTGITLTAAQATDPDYWVGHLRNTVNFADGLTELAKNPARIYIEVGPGKALSSLAGQHDKVTANQVIGTLRHPNDAIADDTYFAAMLGRVWATGGTFDWGQIWGTARRNRVVLPTYAFQRSSYFIQPGMVQAPANDWLLRTDTLTDWGYKPVWTPQYAACDVEVTGDLSDVPAQTWLIFEDEAGMLAPLSARLRKAGHQVVTVRPGDTFARTKTGYIIAPERGRESYDLLIRDLASTGHLPSRIVHGWLVTQGETFRPGSSFFHRTQEQGFWSLLFLAQALADEGIGGPLHLNILTSDAMQVRTEPLRYPDKATIIGPARVIPHEFPGVTVSVLDLLPKRTTPDQVLEEILATPANGTAALRDGKRFALGFKPMALAEIHGVTFKDKGTYLITGGFGGIGLTIAEALMTKFGANIILIARQALPPRETWTAECKRRAPTDPIVLRICAMQRLQAVGNILTIAADVSNVEEMRAAIATATARFGPINGVIHAAGVVDDAPMLTKQPMAIEDVFTPKIHGTQVLDALFPDGSLDLMALFSSTSTLTAPAGQVDYVAANEYLNAFAKSRAGGKTKVVAINWGLWAEVGMAATAMQTRTGLGPAPVEPAGQPMLDSATFDAAGNRLFTATYTAPDRWFLNEHRTKAGDALMPGTGYLELVAEALAAQHETGPFEIRDLAFLRPLRVDGQPTLMTLHLPRSETGYGFSVETAGEVNAEAEVSLLPMPVPKPLDLPAIMARLPAFAAMTASPQEAHLKFGPRWRTLTEVARRAEEGLARLQLPPQGAENMDLHPGLMDLATGWAMGLIAGYTPSHLWVPVSYASVKVYKPLPAEILSWVRNAGPNRADGQTASFDITICAPDGTICVDISAFTIRRLEGAIRFAAAPVIAAKPAIRPLSAAEERLRHNLTQGIRPAEGVEVFLRALDAGQSQVIVSSLDLSALVAQAAATETAKTDQSFDRPQLDSDYVAPANDIERKLAGFWQDLLGVSQVGADDSFFDLGGHSLIAVRLFAMVKKAYAIDFPISILFEAPTIRSCAALIAAQGVPTEAGADPVAIAKPAARRFTHLVPMHQGEGGRKTPFFLVAGMFGNVLNLRHLAHLLGTDRPFYGLQARGLYGDEAPHSDLAQAAKDYIAEIKAVQPHGPYMLGGFSGGGITALEIAQQLTALGDDVASLVMLDTPLPIRRPLTRADRIAIQKQEFRAGGIGYPLRWLSRRIKWEFEKRKPKTETETDAPQFHNAAIEAAFMASVTTYDLQPWVGPLALFRPALVGNWQVAPGRWVSSERAYVTHDNDWTAFAPKVEVFEVPGNHDSMVLEPNVRVLAARIKLVIEAAERGKPAAWPMAEAAE